MKIFFLFSIFFLISFSNLKAQSELMDDLKNLINTEKAFAEMAITQNTVKAFYHFLADDGIVFNPEIINGKSLYKDAKPSESQLIWRPVYADISKSGDLGLSTGPFEVKRRKGEKSIAFGHFVSVWEKQPSKEWRNVIDIGISHEYTDSYPDDCEYPYELKKIKKIKDSRSQNKDAFRDELCMSEENFLQEINSNGLKESFIKFSDKNVKLYRNNHLPVTGIQQAVKLLDLNRKEIKSKTVGTKTSASGDFGYTYGVMTHINIKNVKNNIRSSFLRVWKKNKSGSWKIILDLTKEIPKA